MKPSWKDSSFAIADEHNSEAWANLFSFGGLLITPKDRSEVYPSSGAVLRLALEDLSGWDGHCTNLTVAADLADKTQFIGLGEVVNKAIKAKIDDQQRRVYLAEHFANNYGPDNQINKWVEEYEVLKANTEIVVELAYQDGNLYFFDSREHKVDRTSMVRELDRKFPTAKVGVCRGFAYDRDREGLFPCYTFMLRNGFHGVNLREILPNGWGMESVMNVEDDEYSEALELVRASL
jgi:hypothetical protein